MDILYKYFFFVWDEIYDFGFNLENGVIYSVLFCAAFFLIIACSLDKEHPAWAKFKSSE